MPTREQPSRRGSVQEAFVHAREIAHNVLCLASPGSPTQREYRAILEVSSTNYTLKSEEEQDLMITGYRAFLKALAFPIQILVRSQKLDLSPYVQHLEETAAQSAADPMWRDLADSNEFGPLAPIWLQAIPQRHQAAQPGDSLRKRLFDVSLLNKSV